MRIDHAAKSAGVAISYELMVMPPVYAALGWKVNPFVDYPYKLDYVWCDVARTAEHRDVAFQKPKSFPQDPFPATLVALVGFEDGWGWEYCRHFYAANFHEGRDPAAEATLVSILSRMNLDAEYVIAKSQSDEIRQLLDGQTLRALERGVFGAPFFIVNDERFWGDDRMELAMEWAQRVEGNQSRQNECN